MRAEDLERLRLALASSAAQRIDDPDAKQAAVAVILRAVADEVEVLLIRRADRVGDHWSGHMAFPGGRAEPFDADLAATAVRETFEEVGLALPASGVPLGPLDQQLPRSSRGLVVSPWVWLLHAPEVALAPNGEVAEVLWAPLGPMMRGELDDTYLLRWNGVDVKMPAFRLGQRIVWGMTHRMLLTLFERLR